MIPTEHEGTVAVDAAARFVWDATRSTYENEHLTATFDQIGPLKQREIREQVLPLVWAVLAALPDRNRLAWFRGHAAGVTEGPMAENPYPASPS